MLLFFGFFSTFTPSTLFKTPLSHCPSITTDHAPPLSSRLPFFSYMRAYLSAAATDASATNTNETRRGEVGLRSGGIDRERGGGGGGSGGGWARGEFRERMTVLCVCVCLCQKPGGLSDIILPRTIQILPPKTFPSCFAFSLGESHAWAHRNTHIAKNN